MENMVLEMPSEKLQNRVREYVRCLLLQMTFEKYLGYAALILLWHEGNLNRIVRSRRVLWRDIADPKLGALINDIIFFRYGQSWAYVH